LGCMVRFLVSLSCAWFKTDLLGRVECVYEPAMTKAFLHGRTEAIRSVQPQSVEFTKVEPIVARYGWHLALIMVLDVLLGRPS